MQVLILGDDHGQQARLAAAMMKTGFQVICVESAAAAASFIRSELIDVLVLTETRSGRISQSCACVEQSRNRAVSVIVISDRTGAAMNELFEEVPQLYGVMGLDMAPAMVSALALASILPQQVGMAMPRVPSTPGADLATTGPVTAQQHGAAKMPRANAVAAQADPVRATPADSISYANPAIRSGSAAQLSRTLIEPARRPIRESAVVTSGIQPPFSPQTKQPTQAQTVPADAPFTGADPVLAPIAAQVLAKPAARADWPAIPTQSSQPRVTRPAPVAPGVAPVSATTLATPAPRFAAADWATPALSDASDIGTDLDALERELDLVNRDRPSVLAASIADELPSWSHPAPKLALLTDWALASPASTDLGTHVGVQHLTSVTKVPVERRLALGVTLQ